MTGDDLPEDPLSDALQRVLLAHTQAQGRLSRRLNMRRGDVDALEHLMVGPLSPGELAGRLGVSGGAVTQLVDRMESRGHALRTTDEGDRRRVRVELTADGRETVRSNAERMLRRLDGLAASLSDAEADGVMAYLRAAESALHDLAAD